jgi:iron complex transport system substrate-binding protein
MPCGFDAARSLELAEEFEGQLRAAGARKIACVDGSATFSRPGPRLVDGLENLAHILHPGAVPNAPGPILEL